MMQNSSTEYPEYSGYHPFEVANDFNDPPYENTLLTHPPLTQRNVSQQNNNFSMHQNLQIFSNSFNAFEENINRQLNELKRLLNQIRQFIIAQQPQQTSMPRRIYRNHAPRPHPYLNERPLVSSRTPTIRYAAPAYRHTTEQLSSPDALHRQQTNVPAETTDDTQDYEFWENS